MRWKLMVATLVVAAIAVVSSCSSGDDSSQPDVVTGENPEDDAPDSAEDSTVDADAEVGVSQGTITIDAADYVLEFRCFSPPDGNVSAIGVGDGAAGISIEALVELDPDAPYVGLRFDEADSSTWVESSLEAPLDVFVEDGRIFADSVQFVRDIDLDTGEGTWVGAGHVDIPCNGFDTSSPS